jgi:hypothetical protein
VRVHHYRSTRVSCAAGAEAASSVEESLFSTDGPILALCAPGTRVATSPASTSEQRLTEGAAISLAGVA